MAKSSSEFKKALQVYKDQPRNPVHSFHRYFGKLIPGIPAFAIETFSKEGDFVLDPFSGSGTTVVEANERNRQGVGTDINPLATFVAGVKSSYIAEDKLTKKLNLILDNWKINSKTKFPEEPYVVNMDHWFRPEVKNELLFLKQLIIENTKADQRNFFLATFSAFMRGVSNADPRHVFPGHSKRMRKLDEEGRTIDVKASFIRASKKRIKQINGLNQNTLSPILKTGSFNTLELELNKKVDLVVTNPPYISSIRYLETMKIEMGWLGYLTSQKDYLALDKSVIGTERFYKDELTQIGLVGYSEIDKQIKQLAKVHQKMSKTVFEYFVQMDLVFKKVSNLIKKGGHLVIKISDSKVRTELIATHKHFITICEKYGFELLEDIIDEFDPNSRSLLTARNTYSGIMTFDHVLIFRKS
jgi:DNA modification methylase